MKTIFPIILMAVLLLAFPTPAQADGIIIPQPPICDPCPPPPCPFPGQCPPPAPIRQLAIRYHHVTVTIQDQLAVTHIDQVFFNPNPWDVEGLYMFPIPIDAAISSFTLWIDGEPVQGQILEAEQAKQQYWEIVNSLQDPALLEYIDRGAFQAHIFPIPSQGERRIEIEYVQTLAAENGLVRYVYPLNTEKYSIWPVEQVSIHLDIKSSQPIQAVYSPSHSVELDRQSPQHVKIGYESSQVIPDKDFALYYSSGSEQALHLLTYRDPNDPQEPDGFFLLLLTPPTESESQKLPKDVILVLDRSGSMEGEKFRQAQDALGYILEKLNPEDRFNIIAFSTATQAFSPGLESFQAVPQAIQWLERLNAQGSTDIHRALLEAVAMDSAERPTYLIFLTDGLPTEGVVESRQILDDLKEASSENIRLFSFGVGYDVDTFLLDSLTQAHHGMTTYVLPGQQLDEILSGFYAKINSPVLTDLQLDFGDLSVYDVFPDPIPDLFEGSQIILSGRYRHGGVTNLTLLGKMENQTLSLDFPDQLFSQEKSGDPVLAALPQIWATRKIGYLLNQIRLEGPDEETISQIVHLSIRYGIVTPYTSYLVSENAPLGAAAQERIVQEEVNQIQSAPAAPAFGQAAVEKSAYQASMAEAESQLSIEPSIQQNLRRVGSHSFILKGDQWIDTAFDPDRMQTHPVEFLSQEYLELANSDPELAAAFSLGPKVIAVRDGSAYEVTLEKEINAQAFERLPVLPETDPTATQPASSTSPSPGTPTTGKDGNTSVLPVGCTSAFLTLGGLGFILVKRHLTR